MSAATFFEVLKEWEGSQVTIINPESYTLGKLGDKITLESYDGVLTGATEDHIHVTFTRPKKGDEAPVEQYIPIRHIKRISLWGQQKFVQI